MELNENDILKRYLLNRNDILLTTDLSNENDLSFNEKVESAIDKFPSSLFNKKVILSNKDFVGFMMKVHDNKIVVFGDYDQRYDVPISKACEVRGNLVLEMNWSELNTYKIGSSAFNSQE